MQKKSKVVDRGVLLRKKEINFAIFELILKIDLRGAVPSLLDEHNVLPVLDSVRV